MKERLYILPVKDALRVNDECPFCHMERSLEQYALDRVLGSSCSYMESDVREVTDREGFCRDHYRKMFAYGNALGNSLILETHLRRLKKDLQKEMNHYSENGKSSKPTLMGRFRSNASSVETTSQSTNNVSRWIHTEESSCHICNIKNEQFKRYLATFFCLYQQGDEDCLTWLNNGNGVCLSHLAQLLDTASDNLKERHQEELRKLLFAQTESHLNRMINQLEWFQKKFDYRYRDADWNGAQDAVPRAMQKIAGGYPADVPYKGK